MSALDNDSFQLEKKSEVDEKQILTQSFMDKFLYVSQFLLLIKQRSTVQQKVEFIEKVKDTIDGNFEEDKDIFLDIKPNISYSKTHDALSLIPTLQRFLSNSDNTE